MEVPKLASHEFRKKAGSLSTLAEARAREMRALLPLSPTLVEPRDWQVSVLRNLSVARPGAERGMGGSGAVQRRDELAPSSIFPANPGCPFAIRVARNSAFAGAFPACFAGATSPPS